MIEALTGQALIESMTGLNEALAGKSLQEAYDMYMRGQYGTDNGPPIGFNTWTSNVPAISGDTQDSVYELYDEDPPTEVWDRYVEQTSSQVSDTTGGIVSGSKVGTFVWSIMEEHRSVSETVVKAVVPVAVPVRAAIAGISQLLGVSMEVASLEASTERALMDAYAGIPGVIYDDAKGLVTAWKDELGRILFPKSAVQAVNDSLIDLGVPLDGSGAHAEATSDLDTGNATQPIPCGKQLTVARYINLGTATYTFRTDHIMAAIANNPGNLFQVGYVFASSLSGVVGSIDYADSDGNETHSEYRETASFTHDGKTVYYHTGFATQGYNIISVAGPHYVGQENFHTFNKVAEVAWTLVYGIISVTGYPQGMSQSEADSYTVETVPVAGELATSYEDGVLGTEPLVPVHLTEDPYDTTGSTTDPIDPTDDDNPGVVNPPIPLPIPDTRPSNPSIPLVNPSVIDSTLVDQLVEELATTIDPQPAQSSGIIPIPQLPGITDPETGIRTYPSIIPDSGPGFIHVYNPTPSEFVSFGTWLWVTYADATIDKILNNPFDGVIGAHELYATPSRGGRDNIRSAFLTCPTTADLVPNRYTEIDCGNVIVPEFYGNYLDYSPYSQAYIYLPFIGINEVSIDDIVGHLVNIRYRIDSYSGSCIAMIFVAKNGYQNLCYQFAGNCAVDVPMAGGSQAAIKAGMMQAEAYARAAQASAVGHLFGAIGSALMGSLGGTLSGISGIINDYGNAKAGVEAARVANKSSVQHSGQFGASHGAMGEKVPFILIRNPVQVKVVNYNEDYGFPAHKRVIVGGCRGYLRVREVNVISAHATDDEKAQIEALLKNGVYVS